MWCSEAVHSINNTCLQLFLTQILKYAIIVLRADDNGNGGAFALYAQLKRGINEAVDSTVHDQVQQSPVAQQQQSPVAQQQQPTQPGTSSEAPSRGKKVSNAVRSACTTTLHSNGWRMRVQVGGVSG